MATGFLYDPRFLDHDAGRGHPERRERLVATMDYLEDRGRLGGLVRVEAAEADPAWIETVHDASYVARAEETCLAGVLPPGAHSLSVRRDVVHHRFGACGSKAVPSVPADSETWVKGRAGPSSAAWTKGQGGAVIRAAPAMQVETTHRAPWRRHGITGPPALTRGSAGGSR